MAKIAYKVSAENGDTVYYMSLKVAQAYVRKMRQRKIELTLEVLELKYVDVKEPKVS